MQYNKLNLYIVTIIVGIAGCLTILIIFLISENNDLGANPWVIMILIFTIFPILIIIGAVRLYSKIKEEAKISVLSDELPQLTEEQIRKELDSIPRFTEREKKVILKKVKNLSRAQQIELIKFYKGIKREF